MKKKIGFIIEDWPLPYHYASASTRLRVYDIIRLFRNNQQFSLELYKPWKKYDLVFFQKRDKKAFILAQKLQKSGTKIVLDVNANIFDKSLYGKGFFKKFDNEYFENITQFARFSDYIAVTSPYLKIATEKIFGNKAIFLPENISDTFFEQRKHYSIQKNTIHFVYAGYSSKADQLYLIKSQLEQLAQKYTVHYLLICEQDPHLAMQGVHFKYVPFRNRNIHKKLLLGDIFLAPRNTTDSYNLAHSFTKIGLPMSTGIPIIASPLPSYENSPAILIDSFDDEWIKQIENLILNKDVYTKRSSDGIEYCKNHFSSSIVYQKYIDFFTQAL